MNAFLNKTENILMGYSFLVAFSNGDELNGFQRFLPELDSFGVLKTTGYGSVKQLSPSLRTLVDSSCENFGNAE